MLELNLSRQSSLNIEARNYSIIESGHLIADWLIFHIISTLNMSAGQKNLFLEEKKST